MCVNSFFKVKLGYTKHFNWIVTIFNEELFLFKQLAYCIFGIIKFIINREDLL